MIFSTCELKLELIRSLVLTSLLAIKTLADLAISNNFDERYPLVERAQEEPIDVPCKYCILTAKLGYSNRPLVNLKILDENEKHSVLSKDIPLSNVNKRNYHTKRKMSSLQSLHELNHFRLMYKSRRWIKKIKLVGQLSRYSEIARVIRNQHFDRIRRTRSAGFNVLPKRRTMTMHPIATDNELVEITKNDSSPESETTSLRVKQRIKIITKPFKLHPKNKTQAVDNETKLFKIFPKALSTEEVRYNAGVSQRYTTKKSQEEITKNPPRTLVSETTTEIEHIVPTFKSYAQSNATRIIKGYIELDHFNSIFYNATFKMLSSINPPDRRENGISFVQSGLFLYSFLSALYLEVNQEIQQELKAVLDTDNLVEIQTKLNTLRHIIESLPPSEEDLKLRWSTRLMVNGSWTPSTLALDTLCIMVEHINATATPEQLTVILNHKVEEDSGGAMRNTFEEDELAEGVSGVLLNTLYLRARWRSAPTLLNGTRPFRDAPEMMTRMARMIRINDIMHYASLPEWDAEAVEISYSTPGLSLLLLVPRGRSLRNLSVIATEYGLSTVYDKMHTLRVAVTMPMYTLRMTLLLTNKLQAMGLSRLVDAKATNAGDLRLSHAVQRIMFWAEAGRNAFKDDGFDWDEAPQLEMLVDRPYLFYVRWRNFTLLNGNFVL